MKKVFLSILLILLGFSVVFANYKEDLEKYYGYQVVEKVDAVLDKWNEKVLKLEDPVKVYDRILLKIDKKLPFVSSEKIKILLLYIKDKILSYKEAYLSTVKSNVSNIIKNEKIVNEKQTVVTYKKLDNVDFSVIKRDNIIVPITNKKYAILWFYFKSLYWDSSLYSLVLKNEYWNEADFLVKNLYLLNRNQEVLAEWKMVNWIVYFELKSPYLLIKDFNTTFYVAVELNEVLNENQTNKRIKLSIIPEYSTFKTKLISNVNGNESTYYVSSSFNSNTYYIRKSTLLLKNNPYRWKLHVWTNKIYSINFSSTWADAKISKLIFKTNIGLKGKVDTWDVQVYVNNSLYKNCKAYFEEENWNTKLHIDFNYPFWVGVWKTIDIYANFVQADDRAYIYTKLEQVSENTEMVDWNYTWTYSILWSDDALKSWVSLDSTDYFTDALLNFDNVTNWYLKN